MRSIRLLMLIMAFALAGCIAKQNATDPTESVLIEVGEPYDAVKAKLNSLGLEQLPTGALSTGPFSYGIYEMPDGTAIEIRIYLGSAKEPINEPFVAALGIGERGVGYQNKSLWSNQALSYVSRYELTQDYEGNLPFDTNYPELDIPEQPEKEHTPFEGLSPIGN